MAASPVTAPGDLPRVQVGANPQHLIVTLLGDYWFGRKEHLPSAGLVALANEFGITSTSARAALSRLARRDLLDSSKNGRRTFYGLTPHAERVLDEERERLMAFGAEERAWDGTWSVVVFSVPEVQRETRHVLRTRLRWLGYAPLYDGAWVSPHASTGETSVLLLEELHLASATVLTSQIAHATPDGDPLSAWDLEELRGTYESFIDEFGALLARVDAGDVGAAEAMVARTRIMDVWRRFPDLDPELPEAVLPARWPRREAQAIFVRVYDALGPLAVTRFQHILGAHEPGLAELASPLTARRAGARMERA